MSSDVIEVDGLDKIVRVGFWGRKKTLLQGVGLRLVRGRTLGFVGANGAGKSTTIKQLVGGARPTAGTVRVLGDDPRSPRVRQRIGFMPEQPPLPPTLSPADLIALHARLCGVPTARGSELLDQVGLAEHRAARVGTFSKGMQTRLCLALALLHEPELLILDEPMSGLDPVGRELVRRILREQAAAGRSILFSSHVLSDVEALCDDVAVIDRGRIVYLGSARDAVGVTVDRWRLRLAHAGGAPVLPFDATLSREGDTWVAVVDGADGLSLAVRAREAGAVVLSLAPERASLEARVLQMVSESKS
jgi:ABC-2 type transport system ATP-binding protein